MGGEPGSGADGWPAVSRVRRWGLFGSSRRVARATTTRAHASAPRWGETWARSIKIPRFLAALGGRAYSLRPPWHVPGGPWVWSLGLFSPIFFLHIHKQKKKDPMFNALGTHRLPDSDVDSEVSRRLI